MSDWVVPLSKAAQQFDLLGAEVRAAAFRGLVLAGVRGLQKLQIQILPRRIPQPVDRGVYRAGWKLRIGPDYVEIYNDSPIASIIEDGVRAKNVKVGLALLEALSGWVMRKGLSKDSKEARSIAWAVARNMQKRGIFNDRGPYKNGLGILRELVDHYLDALIEAEVLASIGKI